MHMPYIQQSHNKIYYFRLAMPTDLRQLVGRDYIRRTLKTKDPNTAFIRAQYLLAYFRKQFSKLRFKMAKDKNDFDVWINPEIKIGNLRIEEGGRVIDLKDIETETPEETATIMALLNRSTVQPLTPVAPVTPLPFHIPTKTLSSYLSTYLKMTATNSSERYVEAIKDAVDNFIEYVGDICPETITSELAQDFAASFATWPANRRKKPAYRDKKLFEILENPIPPEDSISKTTYNNNIRKLSSFLIWLQEQKALTIENPFKRLFKKEKVAKQQWSKFSDTEVQQILSKVNIVFDAKRPSRYWIPLILAHSGARIEEICGLYHEDIESDPSTGIWYIKIQDDKPDKRIKTEQSLRDIPVHSFLEKIGFLKYVASIPAGTRLFPDLTYKDNYGYHDQISDYFSRYLKRINVYQPKKTLKSFRHTVITALYQTGASSIIVPEIVGHSPDSSSMSQSRYHKGYQLQQKKDALEKIDWNLTI